MVLIFQNSSYSNRTLAIQNKINYNTSINFFKYGFYGNFSRYFLDNKLSFSIGIRTDGDSFTDGSGITDNISPRLSFSYKIQRTKNGVLIPQLADILKSLHTQCWGLKM